MMDNMPEDRTTHLLVGGAGFFVIFLLAVIAGTFIGRVTGIYFLGLAMNIIFGFLIGQRFARWYVSLPPQQGKSSAWTEDDWR